MPHVIHLTDWRIEEDETEPDLVGQQAYAAAKEEYERSGKIWSDLTRMERLPLYRKALSALTPGKE